MVEIGVAEERRRWALVVAQFYRGVIQGCHGRIPVPNIPVGSKTEDAALLFYAQAVATGRGLKEIMEWAVGFYGEEWCREQFGRPYPPFAMVVAAPSRMRISKAFPEVVPMSKESQEAEAEHLSRLLVSTLGLEAALETLEAGWPPDHGMRSRVRKHVLERKVGG